MTGWMARGSRKVCIESVAIDRFRYECTVRLPGHEQLLTQGRLNRGPSSSGPAHAGIAEQSVTRVLIGKFKVGAVVDNCGAVFKNRFKEKAVGIDPTCLRYHGNSDPEMQIVAPRWRRDAIRMRRRCDKFLPWTPERTNSGSDCLRL